jgi:hypothetical protein
VCLLQKGQGPGTAAQRAEIDNEQDVAITAGKNVRAEAAGQMDELINQTGLVRE